MKTVGVDEAKTHLARLLDEVEQGECITITRHGKPIARLSPAELPEQPPTAIQAILDEFESFRGKHRGAFEGLEIRELIEHGRKY